TGAILARHFLEQGATRIQFVMSKTAEDFRARQRAQGYADAMTSAGLITDIQVVPEDDEFEAGAIGIEALSRLPEHSRPQALIFANDNMAAGAILHAPSCKLVLPRDCAIAGFGDAPICARLRPALTTLRPARYQIGQHAARTVLKQLTAGPGGEQNIIEDLLPCDLIIRESSQLHL
ncbi:MAG TPA: substrate-binding domain-containing protein, partial [Advenella sp.]|nr:substrate-binding domain-containing protein [Advenella sp.]